MKKFNRFYLGKNSYFRFDAQMEEYVSANRILERYYEISHEFDTTIYRYKSGRPMGDVRLELRKVSGVISPEFRGQFLVDDWGQQIKMAFLGLIFFVSCFFIPNFKTIGSPIVSYILFLGTLLIIFLLRYAYFQKMQSFKNDIATALGRDPVNFAT